MKTLSNGKTRLYMGVYINFGFFTFFYFYYQLYTIKYVLKFRNTNFRSDKVFDRMVK